MMYQIKVLLVLFVLCSKFVFLFANESAVKLLEKAEKMSDFSKENYDRNKAVSINCEVLNNEKIHLHLRLDACFAICQLYLYRCKKRNATLGKKYLEKYIALSGGKITRDLSFIKTYYLNTFADKDKEIEFIKAYAWVNYAYFNLVKEDTIIYPYNCNTLEKKIKYKKAVASLILVTFDTLKQKYAGYRGKDKKAFNLAKGVFEESILNDQYIENKNVFHIKALQKMSPLIESKKINEKPSKDELDGEKEVVTTEVGKFDEKTKAFHLKVKKWIEKDKKNHLELIKFIEKDLIKLLAGKDGKEKVIKYLESRKKMWADSPLEEEVLGLLKRIKNSEK